MKNIWIPNDSYILESARERGIAERLLAAAIRVKLQNVSQLYQTVKVVELRNG